MNINNLNLEGTTPQTILKQVDAVNSIRKGLDFTVGNVPAMLTKLEACLEHVDPDGFTTIIDTMELLEAIQAQHSIISDLYDDIIFVGNSDFDNTWHHMKLRKIV